MEPLISVITPFYNAAHTLRYSLTSLLTQTYQNWECVLVDDGSEDDAKSIINEFQDPRIHYHRLERNQGRGAARQHALDQAQGEYLCFLDADDWIYPQRLETQLRLMQENPELSMLSVSMAVVGQDNQIIGKRGLSATHQTIKVFPPMKRPCSPRLPLVAAMVKMEAAKESGFDPSLRRSEDLDFFLRILTKFPYGVISEILYVYREFLFVEKRDVLLAYQSRINVLNKYRMLYPLASRITILSTRLKQILYGLAFDLGIGENLIKSRTKRATKTEILMYENILQELLKFI